ncbi:MAG: 3-hydroxyacyl-ACP dehydratase FabZ [Epulopiscium sp.]|nr:3-hydroxyacyl-ACP dehydratase FabZ [Candidatus Epulonipiscium sp.]
MESRKRGNHMNAQEIQQIIPHRPPFLLIDRMLSLEAGRKGVGLKNVTINEAFFQGHFPTEPIMPGVLIMEALAQVGAVVLLSVEDFKGKTAYFGGMNKVRFKRKVVPGDQLRLEVEIVTMRGSIGIGKGMAFVGDEKAAEGEMTFVIGLK